MKPARLIAILFMISVLGVLVAVPVMCTSAFVHAVSSGDAIEFSSEAEFEGDPVQLGVNKLDGACKKIIQQGPIDVVWVRDSKNYFEAEGDSQYLKHAIYKFQDGTLMLGTDKVKLKEMTGKIRVVVHGPQPESFSLEGSGDFSSDTFKGGDFSVSIAGSGDVALKGALESLNVSVAGSGNVMAPDLACTDADVNIAGRAKVDINPRSKLSANIVGFGEVVYHGRPDVSQTIIGSGSVRKQ